MQSRAMSFIEAASQTAAGYFIALGAQFIIYPMMGIPVSITQNLILCTAFTSISVVRNYIFRRFSNHIGERLVLALARLALALRRAFNGWGR